jgi:hypothetical protein
MGQSLVAFDTDRIKDYVFATGRLAEIRGASALLIVNWRGRMDALDVPGLTQKTVRGQPRCGFESHLRH